MGAAFAEPRQHAAARVIVGTLTAGPTSPAAAEKIARTLGAETFRPDEVAAAAGIIIGRVLDDVNATLRLDRNETLALLGRWVAADEFATRA